MSETEEIVFNARDIRAIESAMDSLRDRQLRGAIILQEFMAQTPVEIRDKVWIGDKVANHIKEWDEQMTYWGHFCGLSKKLATCAMLAEGGRYELILRKIGEDMGASK